MRMEDDAADVTAARGGDEDAYRRLVERHSRNVFRLAYRMTRSEHDAEDVVQNAFIKAFRRLEHFESRSNFGTWLHRIAANCAYDVLRTQKRRQREEPLEPDPANPEARALPSLGPSPDRLAESADVRARVARAMSRLSPLERSAFVMRHDQGLSIREIGVALGLDTSATKHSIFRAVRKMRVALEPVSEVAS